MLAEEVPAVGLPAVIEPPARSAQAAILCPAPASHLPAAHSPSCLSLRTQRIGEVEGTLPVNVLHLYIQVLQNDCFKCSTRCAVNITINRA